MRFHLTLLAGLALSGCSYLPSWSVGPPYGDDLAAPHHAADPAPSERAAVLVEVDSYASHEACLGGLAGLVHGEIVRLSPAEARGWRTEGTVTHEYSCAGGTLWRRSWSAEPSAPVHH